MKYQSQPAALSAGELVALWTSVFGEPPPVLHTQDLMLSLVDQALEFRASEPASADAALSLRSA